MIDKILSSWAYKDGQVIWARDTASTGTKAGDIVKSVAKPSGHLVLSFWHERKTHKLQYGRVVWLLVHGEWPAKEIDHIDNNPANNRIENLRLANRSENNWNKTRSYSYGVLKHGATWRIRVEKYGKRYIASRFNTKDEAIEFRDLLVEELFEKFCPKILGRMEAV
jgi:hypothetical protein